MSESAPRLGLDEIELADAVSEQRDIADRGTAVPVVNQDSRNIVARLNGLLEDVSASAGDVITDAIAEIERLSDTHPGARPHVEQMSMLELKDVLDRVRRRAADLGRPIKPNGPLYVIPGGVS